jgi:hypothetical protein
MQSGKGSDASPPSKQVWELITLTKVGSFGQIMQGGSFNQPDGGGNMKMP